MRYSVVMPVYNKRPHVARAIRSVLAQPFSDIELLIVDDASTDGSDKVIDAFTDSRIRRFHRDRPVSAGCARNLGIREAKAEWVAFIDGDDEWQAGFLREVEVLRAQFPDAGGACTAYFDAQSESVRGLDRFSRARSATTPCLLDLRAYVRATSRGLCPFRTSASSFSRELLVRIGGYREEGCQRGEDRDLWFRALQVAPVAWSPLPGATYFRDSVNMMTKAFPPELTPCVEKTLRSYVETLPKRGPRSSFRGEVMRLVNHGKKDAIKNLFRSGQLRFRHLSGFYWTVEPFFALKVLAWAAIPGSISKSATSLVRGLRSVLRTRRDR